jgi:xylulose-5-phosphate/fructose-6-phosphate phosphoketolase
MGTNPLTNPVVRPLVLPDFGEYGIEDPKRGAVMASDTTLLGVWLRDVIKLNEKARNFRA